MRHFMLKSAGCAFVTMASLVFAATAHAAAVPAGNLFYQNGAPVNGNVSVTVNNPQNMAGGNGVGSDYPINDSSPLLDGSLGTGSTWYSGTFSNGGMANIAMTQGYYNYDSSNGQYDSFTNVAFGAIGTIRIYAWEQPTPSGVWNNFPKQIAVAYTTSSFYPGNGYSYNSGTTGVLPWPWGDTTDPNTGYLANITAVNGQTPTAPADSTDYSTSNGWVAGAFTNYVSGDTNSYDSQEDYMDLTVNIPAGATSVMISFGAANTGTGNQGGLGIADVEAFAPVITPEPASLGLVAFGALGLLARRRR